MVRKSLGESGRERDLWLFLMAEYRKRNLTFVCISPTRCPCLVPSVALLPLRGSAGGEAQAGSSSINSEDWRGKCVVHGWLVGWLVVGWRLG